MRPWTPSTGTPRRICRRSWDDVVDGVARKLVYRHPHVFGEVQVDGSREVLANWEVLKRKEKFQSTTADAIEAVPHTLPALWRAEKIGSKTAKAGFDWDSALSALGKLEEEVRELRTALGAGRAADALPRPATSLTPASAGWRLRRTSP